MNWKPNDDSQQNASINMVIIPLITQIEKYNSECKQYKNRGIPLYYREKDDR
jgi:hypothetical protein